MRTTGAIATVLMVSVLSACQHNDSANDGGQLADNDSDAAGATPTGKLPTADHQSQTEIVEVPETGVDLGWGYNAYDAQALANKCVLFSEDEEAAQARTMSMREVNDSYELMKSMDMTAEASVQVIGFTASGKASFAKNLNMTSNSSNFVLDVSVDNGVRYAAPLVASSETDVAALRNAGAIRLTDSAARLAGSDPEEFMRQCGNAFVSAIYSGARLTAVISIKASSQSEKRDISAEVSASGFGATVSGAMHEGSATSASKAEKSMSVFLVGGRGDAIPKDQKDLEAKLETLSYSAYEAPKDFRMAVTPYEVLPNFPQQTELRGAVTEFEQLAGLWGDYNTLYDEIELILGNPGFYASVIADGSGYTVTPLLPEAGGDEHLRYLEKLQDYVHADLRELEAIARQCLRTEEEEIEEGNDCAFDETRFLSGYAYRSQLPLELPVRAVPALPQSCGAVTNTDAYRNCKSAFVAAAKELLNTPLDLQRQVTERWIIDKSHGRCRFDVLDLGCLSNAQMRHWQSKVGQRLTLVDPGRDGEILSELDLAADAGTGAVWSSADEERAIVERLSSAGDQS